MSGEDGEHGGEPQFDWDFSNGWDARLFEDLLRGGELLCIDVLGTQFTVRWGRSVTEEQQHSMRSAWARCASGGAPLIPPLPKEPTEALPFSASVSYLSMYDGGTFALQATSFGELAENVTSRVTVAAILENAGELMMLHACAVASPVTGAVVALVAKSGTGKTTAASVLAGTYGYVSDETVAIGPDGSVVPYPKPLSVKQGPGEPKHQVGPDELGLQPAPAKPFIQSIVLLDRVDAAPRADLSADQQDRPAPVLRQLPLAEALLALVPDSSSQGEIDEPLQSLCRLIDRVGGVWQVTYSEAADLPEALEPLFRKRRRSKPAWEARAAEAVSGDIPEGWIRRVDPQDAVAVGDDLLVMLDAEIVRLSGIGRAIWEATAAAVPLDQLAEEVGVRHGRPEGYQAAVTAAVGQLIAKSVLEQGGH
ncbi:ATP-binding protein [Arthrobacter sp. ISL-69]|uniref:ATP-binding protein n=1 Tax=Arthrobacter sp. ISL-69 TaxID=2819113 RepID=UPI001BED0EF5|nr:ATP-binding protein [Arthrobacter sp. ISL-69]MBT2538252.1 ATP-binding protein [Arthrobacter sp. ISL-69]